MQAIVRSLNARMLTIPSRVSRELNHLTEHDLAVLGDEIALALTALAPAR